MKIFGKISIFFGYNKSYYYPRDYYYENFLSKYENVESYLNLTNLHDKQAILTDRIISFSVNHDFIRNKNIFFKRKYGNPNYIVTNNLPIGKITIKLYRIHIGTIKTKLQLHFFQNTLFMYNYTFSYLNNESERNQLLSVLKEKYLIEKDMVLSNCYIMDKNKSIIVLSDSVDFTICYINNIHSNLFHQMNDIITNNLELKKQTKANYEQELFRCL